jgi:hypothetical protein
VRGGRTPIFHLGATPVLLASVAMAVWFSISNALRHRSADRDQDQFWSLNS